MLVRNPDDMVPRNKAPSRRGLQPGYAQTSTEVNKVFSSVTQLSMTFIQFINVKCKQLSPF